jgi:hypothetical protein
VTVTYPEIEDSAMDSHARLTKLLAGEDWPAWATAHPDAYRGYLQAHKDFADKLAAAGVDPAQISSAAITIAMAYAAGQKHGDQL